MKSKLLTRIGSSRSSKHIIIDFAEKNGLVYFGHIDQKDDDRRIVRGMTVSNEHTDRHYLIGNYRAYDVAFVERSDELVESSGSKHKKQKTWHIMEFDLHTNKELPHIFIGLHSHDEAFYMQLFTKYPMLRALTLGNLGIHSAEFMTRYRIYGNQSRILDVEAILTPEIDQMILEHFGHFAIEISENCLYIYSERAALSPQLLDAMIKNGTWLAGHIDRVAENLQD